MARPYAREMAKLAETFAWAAAADLQPWRQAVRTAGLSPFRAIRRLVALVEEGKQ